jgi:hypothetical protein
MPIHDWTRVDAGIFHDFHQAWMTQLRNALNGGELPPDYYALMERVSDTQFRESDEAMLYARKADRIAVRQESDDRIVAWIEIVSPGDKRTPEMLRSLVVRLSDAMAAGCHLLVIDLHPPGRQDPLAIHREFWTEGTPTVTADEPLSVSAYRAGPVPKAYFSPLAVGATLPDMPLFLTTERYINVPLEATYLAAWKGVPQRWKRVLT